MACFRLLLAELYLMSVNESEALLAEQSRKTFLSLWSYQNPYYAPGKELCDVLVVIGDDVIIMSDKSCSYGDNNDKLVNWKRWHKKAVSGSVRQLRGALKQLRADPSCVFTDSGASSPFPLHFPPVERARYFLVAIAKGAEQACANELSTSGLILDTACKDNEIPFRIGTSVSEGKFVHVLSGTTMDAIFNCFDTATDLVNYLSRKEEALANGRWIVMGEENLIGAYAMSQPGNQHYRIPDDKFEVIDGARTVPLGVWARYQSDTKLQAERAEVRSNSYIIDKIVEDMNEEFQQDRTLNGSTKDLESHEMALRLLARESRLGRQLIVKAYEEIYSETTVTWWANVVCSLDQPGLYVLWMTYPNPPKDMKQEDLDASAMLYATKHQWVVRSKFPDAQWVLAICLPNRECTDTLRILRLMKGNPWTAEDQALAEQFVGEGILNQIDSYSIRSKRM